MRDIKTSPFVLRRMAQLSRCLWNGVGPPSVGPTSLASPQVQKPEHNLLHTDLHQDSLPENQTRNELRKPSLKWDLEATMLVICWLFSVGSHPCR